MCRMNVVTSTCVGQVRRAGMWPSSRSANKPANTPVTLPAANHVNFNLQNPTADSIAWLREAI